MAKEVKDRFFQELRGRYGPLRRVGSSHSLFDVGGDRVRIYVRYSKKHRRNQAFYGLREVDLKLLEGHAGILCFLWDEQDEPLLIPFSEYEEIFGSLEPASDGQYKVQVYEQIGITEFYIASAGRFNVESYFGWAQLEGLIERSGRQTPELSHPQVQTLLGAIGASPHFSHYFKQMSLRSAEIRIYKTFP